MNIIIIGATSGIGLDLLKRYAVKEYIERIGEMLSFKCHNLCSRYFATKRIVGSNQVFPVTYEKH